MDTTEKLKSIEYFCDTHFSCASCSIRDTCKMDEIMSAIDTTYKNMKERYHIIQPVSASSPPAPTEDGTAAGASHYLACPIQPIELMQYTLTKEELIGFLKGNIIKYTLRANHKGTPEKDKAKALQYKKWLDAVLAGDPITI